MSPTYNEEDDVKEFTEDDQKNDQLGKIFQVIGTPKPDESLSFIQNEAAKKYLSFFKPTPKIDFSEKYPAVEDKGLQLLEKMLMFDPQKRISAEEAI